MRLLKSVKRLEAGAAEAQPLEIGLAYTANDVRVEAALLGRGEYIATDVVVLGECAGCAVHRVVERVTRDAGDVGWVQDSEGTRIGRVVEVNGTLVTLEMNGGPVCRLRHLAYGGKGHGAGEEAGDVAAAG
jgi:hypothetical protein